MKTKRITQHELLTMEANRYRMITDCLRWGTVRLIGVGWKEYWSAFRDERTGDIVIEYE